MATVKTYNLQGSETGTLDLDDAVFAQKANPTLIQQVVHVMRANARQPLAHVKDRSEVRGGGKKPWKQKGTGRSRHGSIRSPLWRGGGATFGPRNTEIVKLSIPKKMARKALTAALSDRVAHNGFVVLEDVAFEKPSTKTVAALLKTLDIDTKKVLFVSGNDQAFAILSTRNLEKVSSVRVENINLLDVLASSVIVTSKDVVATLTTQLRSA